MVAALKFTDSPTTLAFGYIIENGLYVRVETHGHEDLILRLRHSRPSGPGIKEAWSLVNRTAPTSHFVDFLAQ